MNFLFAISVAVGIFLNMHDQKYGVSAVSREDSQEKTADKPLFTFGLIADVQYADCMHEGERYYRSSVKKLD
jgi:hypothetical protein